MTEDPFRVESPGDPAALERLHRWGGDALRTQIVEMFLARAPAQIAAALAAAQRGDAEEVRKVAHTLKSSAGQLGAVTVQRLCQDAEHRAESGESSSLVPLVHTLANELERFRAWLYDAEGGGM
ncbi:MAG TPA: Hpt domain-containing protein [Longimicrobium sp.]|jgi:HPt (histidine-containing phosphotransfer) domain-containing protein